jgi:hypothetical protein
MKRLYLLASVVYTPWMDIDTIILHQKGSCWSWGQARNSCGTHLESCNKLQLQPLLRVDQGLCYKYHAPFFKLYINNLVQIWETVLEWWFLPHNYTHPITFPSEEGKLDRACGSDTQNLWTDLFIPDPVKLPNKIYLEWVCTTQLPKTASPFESMIWLLKVKVNKRERKEKGEAKDVPFQDAKNVSY